MQTFPDWLPDWAVGVGRGGPVREPIAGFTGEATSLQGLRPTAQLPIPHDANSVAANIPPSHTPDASTETEYQNATKPWRKERTVAVTPQENRTVQRKLQGIHLFVSMLRGALIDIELTSRPDDNYQCHSRHRSLLARWSDSPAWWPLSRLDFFPSGRALGLGCDAVHYGDALYMADTRSSVCVC